VSPQHATLVGGAGPVDGRIMLARERVPKDGSPSMLDHIGILVDDAEQWRERAEAEGTEIVKWIEAEHSKAVFVQGPDDLLIEFVELTSPLEQA
jgi:catechol 2,3-dioxygenase-like lactoylglutathione lyase family enzyme